MNGPANSGRRPKLAIHEAVAHELGVAIVAGAFKPGDVLPGEERFSLDRRISRSAYREGVRILAAKGLVYSRTRVGIRVNARLCWNMLDPDVLAWMFEAGPDFEFVKGIFELRFVVEPEAAAMAALRRDSRELAVMGAALQEMERWGLLTVEGRAADEQFHSLVVQATRNEPFIALSHSIAAAVRWTSKFAREDRGQSRDPMPDHYAVYDALAQGDAAAARAAMVVLVRNASGDAGAEV